MHLRSLASFVCALVPVVAAAQAPRYTVETLADGVHAVIYNSDIDVEGNTLIVVNDDDVFVVDANAGVTTARRTIEEIRKITPKPVRYVVNTHWHDDHVMGNQAYAEAYRGVQFIAHPLTRQDIIDHAFANNPFVIDMIGADLQRIGRYLETGIGRDGKEMTPEQRARAQRAYDNRVEMLGDRKVFRAVPPTVDVADSMTLKRRSREIEIKFLGRGNTRGDLVVYLPKERILATGDLVVAPIPYATNVYAHEWVNTLDRLMAIPAATIVPGHGPTMRDWSYVRRVKRAIEQTIAAVGAAKKEGLTIAQTTERVQLPELRDSFVAGVETRRPGYEAFFRTSLVRNVWEELDADVMKAVEATTLKKVADGVYVHAPKRGDVAGVTVFLNEKDVVLANAAGSAAATRAAIRAIRELTDKPVRYVIVTAPHASQARGLEVFREVYTQAEIVTADASSPGIVVGDVMTLHRAGREIRITRSDGSLVVEIPGQRIRVAPSGRVELASPGAL